MTLNSLCHRIFKAVPARAIFALVLFVALCSNGSYAITQLEQADSAYNAENFRSALSLYNSVLDKQGASSELYYNIGNAHYRLGNTGKAILAYERALRLDPSNSNAKVNLNFVNSRIKGLPEDGESFLSNIHKGVISVATPNTWGIVAFIFFVLALGCASLYMFASAPGLRKIGFFSGIAALILFVYTFVIAWQTASSMTSQDVGIVVTQNAKLRANPSTTKSSNEKTIAIPEGAKVEIIDSLSTPNDAATSFWYNIKLSNNNQAWIDASDVEKV